MTTANCTLSAFPSLTGLMSLSWSHYADLHRRRVSAASIAGRQRDTGELNAIPILLFFFITFRMSVKTLHDLPNELYFCTFTCTNWLSLFEITQSYDEVYKWFVIADRKSFRTCAFVIMPNPRKNGQAFAFYHGYTISKCEFEYIGQ
ncbi:MAG: hypothetical protein IPG01_11200 [Chitinophagaceae bacterium]|nr:hypothetical protein [Chitinophagaceae bacterium]